jgi:hypothetical protein
MHERQLGPRAFEKRLHNQLRGCIFSKRLSLLVQSNKSDGRFLSDIKCDAAESRTAFRDSIDQVHIRILSLESGLLLLPDCQTCNTCFSQEGTLTVARQKERRVQLCSSVSDFESGRPNSSSYHSPGLSEARLGNGLKHHLTD